MKLFKPATPYISWLMILLLLIFANLAYAAASRPFKATFDVEQRLGRADRCPRSDQGVPGPAGTFNGTGHATHLGAVQVGAEHCLTTKQDMTSVYVFNGKMVLTGANGDVVLADYVGFFTLVSTGVWSFEGNYFITGGTGRFLDASGTGALFGTLQGQFPGFSQTVSLTAEGRISY
jgi:hypothetical protein